MRTEGHPAGGESVVIGGLDAPMRFEDSINLAALEAEQTRARPAQATPPPSASGFLDAAPQASAFLEAKETAQPSASAYLEGRPDPALPAWQRARTAQAHAELEASAEELAAAARPARMTLNRGGQPVLAADAPTAPMMPPAVKPEAEWSDVVQSLPAQAVASTRSAAANLRRMTAEESIIARREALEPAQSDPSGWGALVKPSAIERQQAKLDADRAELAKAIADAAQARADVRLITPQHQTISQEALSSLAQSAGPTLLGLSAGILTRNVPLAMSIAGGGGAAQQAGSTYGEARDEHAATHRHASIAATMDAMLEGGGEMLPLGFALKPGTPIFTRIFGTIAREAGQEAATQLAQDLRAMAMENPKLTIGEVWRNLRVAALAGAGGGAVYGSAGAAVNAARAAEARRAADFLDEGPQDARGSASRTSGESAPFAGPPADETGTGATNAEGRGDVIVPGPGEAPGLPGDGAVRIAQRIHDELGVKVTLDESDHLPAMRLSGLWVPEAQRDRGIGSRALRMITDYADEVGKDVVVLAAPESPDQQERLNAFYERNGFDATEADPFKPTQMQFVYRHRGAERVEPGVESPAHGDPEELSPAEGADRPQSGQPAAEDGDLHAAPALPGAPIVEPAKTGEIKSGFEKVTSGAEAAHALASLRRSPQERVYILALDSENKPLSVLRLLAGSMREVHVSPEVVAKAVYQTPGVARIWFAHNHPSGIAMPSDADRRLTANLAKLFGKGTGVDVAGHVVIAGTRYAEVDAKGELANAAAIPAAARTLSIPITERVVRKQAPEGREEIRAPAAAKAAVARAAHGRSGVAFLDAQNRMVGFVPMTVGEMLRLRTGEAAGADSGARRFYDAAGRLNASGLIVYSPASPAVEWTFPNAARNIAAAAHVADLKALDAIYGDSSMAERGDFPGQLPETFAMRSDGEKPASVGRPTTELPSQATEDTGASRRGSGAVPPSVPPSSSSERAVDAAAHEAATSPKNNQPAPTDAQKEAGNYKKGHARIAGLDVSIENPAGSRRRLPWPVLKSHYGYFKGTVGFDKDHLDVFIKPGTPEDYAGPVFVVNQTVDGKFDEHKVMLGWPDVASARRGYLENYSKGWKGLKSIAEMELEPFKAWAFDKSTTGPRGGEAETSSEHRAVGIALTPPYTPPAETAAERQAAPHARPDAIRQAIRDLFRVPLNEGRYGKSRDTLGIYKTKPQAIRVRNQNDIAVIAHELGHHISETSRGIRAARRQFDLELMAITPYAAHQKNAALQREEGMAEFVRFYLTEPAQAKAKAPGFFQAFDSYLKQSGLKPAVDHIASAISDWQNLPPADRILAKVGESEPEFRKRFNLDRLLFEVFDNWIPMKRMVEDLKPDVRPSADPFKLAHLLAGDAAIIEDWILRERIPFNFEQRADVSDRGKPLAEILKPVQDQHREFGAYLIAKRANELMRRGKEHLYSRDEIAAGLKLETPEFKAAAEALYEYQDHLLGYAVAGGLLSIGAARAFLSHPFYVPFFRVGEKIGGARSGSIFKEIRGGTENLRDPIANIIENTVRVIHATNRNFVLAKAHDLARSAPGGARWLEDVPIPERAVKLETQKIIDQLREQGVEISTEAAEALATSQTFFVQNPFGDDRDRIIIIRRQGRPQALQVNNEMLWRALERFEPVDMGFLEKLLAVPADVLRAGVVLSPDFMARNFARDTLAGFMQSKAGVLPVAGTLDGFKEVATRSDAARLYRAFGGAFGDMWRADSGFERKIVERMALRGGFDPRTILTPRGLLSLLQRLGSLTEAGTRVAEFKKSMGTGSVDELIDAAYNAREVSVDFGMHGHSKSIRFLTRITPFMNPAMQGWYKALRTGGSAPLQTLLRGGVLAAASLALFFTNRDKEWYEEIEQWERNTYWHVDVGLRDKLGQVIPLRIPKPFEWGGMFGSIPEGLAQVAVDQHGERFAKRLASIVDDTFLFRVIPQALLVPAELWANKNQFTGRPIVPPSKERLAPELQAGPGTSLTSRKAGELADVSPAKIDHAIRGFFGTLGTYTVMLADASVRAGGGDPAALPIPWARTPVVRVFFRDPSGASSRHVSEFYEILREARRADASLKRMDAGRMAEYEAKHREAIEQRKSAEKVAKWMADLRRENDQLRADRDLPGEERARMIAENNQQIRWLARDHMRELEVERAAERARTAPAGGAGSAPAAGEPRAQDAASARLRAIRQGIGEVARPSP